MLDATVGRPPKPRLAIVSTFDDLCGIAGYTRFLVKQLEQHFDIEVFDLDQFFMRSQSKKVRRMADQMIREFCTHTEEFDCVNIQLEHGTLGATGGDIVRRFRWIAEAAPALSVTFHTILPNDPVPVGQILNLLSRCKLLAAAADARGWFGNKTLASSMMSILRRQQRRKPVHTIVHTRRDMRLMRYANGLTHVHDHPLAFLDDEQVQRFRAAASRDNLPGLRTLPLDAKIVGVFGFLSEYKGFDTVIRAMHLLPEDHHLLVFGGLHPNDIRKNEPINPYLKRLLREANVGTTVFEPFQDQSLVVQVNADSAGLLVDHPRNIGSRVHFLGSQTDEGFARNLALCDHVVLPYVEVGQSASGVLSIAVEMGARVIAARNHAFIQFSRYHPETIELFEIGNHLELAEKIQAAPAYDLGRRQARYHVGTNTSVYIRANTPHPVGSGAAISQTA